MEIKIEIAQIDELIDAVRELSATLGKPCTCPPKTRKKKKAAPEPVPEAPKPEPEPEPEPTVTVDELRAAMNARAGQAKARAEVIKIAKSYHPQGRIAEVAPRFYPEILAKIEAIDVDA